MKNIVNIQITPVKNILINPLGDLVESFNPNEYTPEQVTKIKKKGYVESTISDIDDNPDNDSMNSSKGKTTTSNTTSSTGNNSSSQTLGMSRNAGGRLNTSIIDNRNFTNINQSNESARAISEQLLDAQRNFTSLTSDVNITNQRTIKQLKDEYESKIRKWTGDYEKSINYYKEYIKNQEKWMKELENQNLTLSDAMQRNTDKLNALAKKWDHAQKKINNFEKELLQSNSKKYDEIIKSLKQQLASEKNKQSSIDEKIAQLRAEKAQLDALFAENVEKLKNAGLGKNCPKDFNMNDYIHKKKIPCWGCIL